MKYLTFILLLAISATAYSQTELPKDSFPSLKKTPIKFDEKLDNYLKTDNAKSSAFDTKKTALEPVKKSDDLKMPDIKLPPINVYLGPPIENNTFTRFPFANDYTFHSGYLISDKSWLSSSSTRNTYPTIGGIQTISMRFNYQPTDWMIISAGPYGSKYNFLGRNYHDTGATGSVKFILHDRIRINGYGQYSAYGEKNKVNGPMMGGMFPQTYYGGTIELKISDKFGVEGGVIRELNPLNGKWENRPYFAPVFYK